jgi:hypothetical protein
MRPCTESLTLVAQLSGHSKLAGFSTSTSHDSTSRILSVISARCAAIVA